MRQIYCFLCNDSQERFNDVTHRIDCGYANGYVAIPSEIINYFDWEEDEDVPVDAHGGITFFEDISSCKKWKNIECIDFNTLDDIPNDYSVIGFDTFHDGDDARLDKDWCIKETKNIANQIKNICKTAGID